MRLTASLSLAFALFLACAAVPAGDMTQRQAAETAMAQPPMTQAELDSYLAIIPEIDKVGDDPMEVFKLYQKSGMSPDRFNLVSFRISVGYMLAQGMTAEQLNTGNVPAGMMPSDAEVELIKKNMGNINAAMGMIQ